MNNDCLAELSGVSKRFGKIVALDGLDLEVRRGELLAVLGPNGAGKTTAISLLLGLRQPDSGTARLFGQSPLRVEARRQVGVMMQEVTLAPELRVREHIDLFASYYPGSADRRCGDGDDRHDGASGSSLRKTFVGTKAAGAVCDGDLRPAEVAVPR